MGRTKHILFALAVFAAAVEIVRSIPTPEVTLQRPQCNYNIETTKEGKFLTNKVLVDDILCVPFTDYQCTVPWLIEYCPGYVKIYHCFNVLTEMRELVIKSLEEKKRKEISTAKQTRNRPFTIRPTETPFSDEDPNRDELDMGFAGSLLGK